jgi:signal transduction histidine kinase
VLADPAGLEQVVINLAVNAKDAMPQGGWLHISARNRPRAAESLGNHVRLEVADTGVGIAPEALEHIFDPFWSTKGEGGHSGLGLAIVDSVVHQMSGTVSVHSDPGHGTAFRIDLPASPGGALDVILRSSSES